MYGRHAPCRSDPTWSDYTVDTIIMLMNSCDATRTEACFKPPAMLADVGEIWPEQQMTPTGVNDHAGCCDRMSASIIGFPRSTFVHLQRSASASPGPTRHQRAPLSSLWLERQSRLCASARAE